MSETTSRLDDVMQRIDADFEGSVDRLCELLRIESVSTDPGHDQQTAACAEHCAAMRSERRTSVATGCHTKQRPFEQPVRRNGEHGVIRNLGQAKA